MITISGNVETILYSAVHLESVKFCGVIGGELGYILNICSSSVNKEKKWLVQMSDVMA